MTDNNDTSKAQALLSSSQTLRTHWSSSINQLMSFNIVTNIAVWTLLIEPYLKIYQDTQIWCHSYLALAATISVVLLALWRWYTYYLDTQIVNLYPEFVYYEGVLSSPDDLGTSGQITRNWGNSIKEKYHELTKEQKVQVIKKLISNKLIGARGHSVINVITLILMVALITIITFGCGIFDFIKLGYGAQEIGIVRPFLKIIAGGMSLLSCLVVVILLCIQPHDPTDFQINSIIDNLPQEKPSSSNLGNTTENIKDTQELPPNDKLEHGNP